jgi:hypothetical protein
MEEKPVPIRSKGTADCCSKWILYNKVDKYSLAI